MPGNGSKWLLVKEGNRERYVLNPKYKQKTRRRGKGRNYRKKRYRKNNNFLSKMFDKKINTVYEQVAQRIAQTEIAKNTVNLCKRDNVYGAYTYSTNTFTRQAVNYDGLIAEVGLVPKANAIEDLDLMQERTQNMIKVTGFSIDLNVSLPENQSISVIVNSTLNWSLVSVYDDWIENPLPPTVKQVIKWKRFGYSALLDNEEQLELNTRKIRTVMKGSVTLRSDDRFPRGTTRSRYIKLKKPLNVEYEADDITQDDPIKYRFYLCVRSNIPTADDTGIFPHVVAMTKMYYHQ